MYWLGASRVPKQFSGRKHVDVLHHHKIEQVENGKIDLRKVGITKMLADFCTLPMHPTPSKNVLRVSTIFLEAYKKHDRKLTKCTV